METESSWAQRLLHRWFVQYNPFYVLSAALVLVGLTLISRGLAGDPSVFAQLIVGGVTEVYAFALIGGAALLTRIGLQRPAVFVALIAILYQGDLSLGTETHALLGRNGQLASLSWIAIFAVKLAALGWALKLRLSRSAWIVPLLGALGLIAVPHLSRKVDSHALTLLVGLWIFALFGAAIWTARRVTSAVDLDDWGKTVMRRSLLATWALWAVLVVGHVELWCTNYHLDPAIFAPIGLLLATRWLRGEMSVLAAVAVVMVLSFVGSPSVLGLTASLAAVVLALHSLRVPLEPSATQHAEQEVYRGAGNEQEEREPEINYGFAAPATIARQLSWAGYCIYLSIWTFHWSGHALPLHRVALLLLVTVAMTLVVLRLRHRVVLLPLFAIYVHASIQRGFLRAPQSTLQWGITTVSVGFALLALSLVVSLRLQRAVSSVKIPAR